MKKLIILLGTCSLIGIIACSEVEPINTENPDIIRWQWIKTDFFDGNMLERTFVPDSVIPVKTNMEIIFGPNNDEMFIYHNGINVLTRDFELRDSAGFSQKNLVFMEDTAVFLDPEVYGGLLFQSQDSILFIGGSPEAQIKQYFYK